MIYDFFLKDKLQGEIDGVQGDLVGVQGDLDGVKGDLVDMQVKSIQYHYIG